MAEAGRRDGLRTAASARRQQRLARIATAARQLPPRLLDSVDRGGLLLRQALRAADDARAAAAYRAAAGDVPRPLHADWWWRPEPWTRPVSCPERPAPANGTEWAPQVKICHDAGTAAAGTAISAALVQTRGGGRAPAPFAITLDCAGMCDASFVSLVFGLPARVLDGLWRGHLIAMHAVIAPCPEVAVFARLNLRSGPNCPQIVRRVQVSAAGAPVLCEFDLHGSLPVVRGVDEIWCDLIFARPAAARIEIADVSFARRPRARF